MKQVYYKSINEIGQDFQFILQEVKHDTTSNELPNLEAAFYQALRKGTKLIGRETDTPAHKQQIKSKPSQARERHQ
jgi:hypothetical protein